MSMKTSEGDSKESTPKEEDLLFRGGGEERTGLRAPALPLDDDRPNGRKKERRSIIRRGKYSGIFQVRPAPASALGTRLLMWAFCGRLLPNTADLPQGLLGVCLSLDAGNRSARSRQEHPQQV